MDRDVLEMKVAQLLRDIEKFDDQDKRKFIVDFIMAELEKEDVPFLLDKFDLTNIASDAARHWHEVPHGKRMGGLPISSGNIRTIMFVHAVVGCLRKYKILHRIVGIKYDKD